MKVGIMQPYIFPYIGYFQLISAVDKFVFYDDVNFIKQGWINRNRILVNGKPHLFTIPLSGASSFSKINDVLIDTRGYKLWLGKFQRTCIQAYNAAPFFSEVHELIRKTLSTETSSIGVLAKASVTDVCDYIGLKTPIVDSSIVFDNQELSGAERVVDICRQLSGTTYINPIGGQGLYSPEYFQSQGLGLNFIQPNEIVYPQLDAQFVPWLSMIDVMMYNSPSEIKVLLNRNNLQ